MTEIELLSLTLYKTNEKEGKILERLGNLTIFNKSVEDYIDNHAQNSIRDINLIWIFHKLEKLDSLSEECNHIKLTFILFRRKSYRQVKNS